MSLQLWEFRLTLEDMHTCVYIYMCVCYKYEISPLILMRNSETEVRNEGEKCTEDTGALTKELQEQRSVMAGSNCAAQRPQQACSGIKTSTDTTRRLDSESHNDSALPR